MPVTNEHMKVKIPSNFDKVVCTFLKPMDVIQKISFLDVNDGVISSGIFSSRIQFEEDLKTEL